LKITDIYNSGILARDEQISCFYSGTQYFDKDRLDGIIILTTNRFLFVKKPPGLFSKGVDVVLSLFWDEIVSVSTAGLLFKKLRISVQNLEEISLYIFSVENMKDVVETILFNKNLNPSTDTNPKIIEEENGKISRNTQIQKRLPRY
jgi:hypothetical protein